jgi:hypothetical protein
VCYWYGAGRREKGKKGWLSVNIFILLISVALRRQAGMQAGMKTSFVYLPGVGLFTSNPVFLFSGAVDISSFVDSKHRLLRRISNFQKFQSSYSKFTNPIPNP